MSTVTSDDLALMALTSMAIFSDTFVLFLIFLTFRRHSGLYFWTLIGTALSQIAVCIATILSSWVLGDRLPGVPLALASFGNTLYVVFEFLVLYSRLHLLGATNQQLRLILGIIYSEWVLVEIPLMILSIYNTLNPENILAANIYSKWWDVEAILYILVDCSLSAMYFVLLARVWGEERGFKRVHWNILAMMILILCVDGTYILFAFSKASKIVLGITLFTFSLKLPVELYALNMLTEKSKSQMRSAQQDFSSLDFSGGSCGSQTTTHVMNSTLTTTMWDSKIPEVRKHPEPLLPE